MGFFKNNVEVTTDVSSVTIGISGYDKDTDLLLVFRNGAYCELGIEYNISSDSLTITKVSGTWDGTLSSIGFNFIVLKNIPDASLINASVLADGSLSIEKLTNDLQTNINKIPDLESSLADITQAIIKSFPLVDDYIGLSVHSLTDPQASTFYNYGFRLIRIDLYWSVIETSIGVYNWTTYDAIMNNAKNNGLQVLFILDYDNNLYTTYADKVTGFKNYVSAATTRYKDNNVVWEFYNEVNMKSRLFLDTRPVYTTYADVLSQIYPIIKSNDITSIVAGPALATRGSIDVVWFKNCCIAGMLDYLDVITIHHYGGYPESYFNAYDPFKSIVKKYNKKSHDIPIWIGESGYSTGSSITESTRAKFIPRLLLTGFLMGMDKIIIYCGQTNYVPNTDYESCFGLWDTSLNSTSTAEAFKTLVDQILGYRYMGEYPSKKLSDHVLTFMNDSFEVKYVYWSTDPTIHKIEIEGNYYDVADSYQVITGTYSYVFKNILYTILHLFTAKNNISLDGYSIVNDACKNYLVNDGYVSGFGNNSMIDGKQASTFGMSNLAGYDSLAEGLCTVSFPSKLYTISSIDTVNKIIYLDNVTDLIIGAAVYQPQSYISNPLRAIITAIDSVNNTITVDAIPTNLAVGILISHTSDATQYASHSEGINTQAIGLGSHAGGFGGRASGYYSFTHGQGATASGVAGAAFGNKTNANVDNSFVVGSFNKDLVAGDVFVVGNGTGDASKNNMLRVSKTAIYGNSSFNSTGADYGEFFEWRDGNIDNEDRVGYFVTLNQDKIQKASNTDSYILGVVSAISGVIGNSHQDNWRDKYLTDVFGRVQYEEIEIPSQTDNDGNIIISSKIVMSPKINPNYDDTQSYTPREQRKEWSVVGMMGQLIVRDDGTCQPNSYCKPTDGGIATTNISGYRVLKRISANVILILFK